jgi:GNAT superfamily N-acetyltransferase
MDARELERIGDMDRSERITQSYVFADDGLRLVDVDIHAPRWGEPGEASVQHLVDEWRPLAEAGTLLGAFEGDDLAGFAIYRPDLEPGMAQLAVLHVSRPFRGTGVGSRLTEEVVRLARADGASRLYVSSTPTRATVDFYMRRGFVPTSTPNAALFELEPEDIHMEMNL